MYLAICAIEMYYDTRSYERQTHDAGFSWFPSVLGAISGHFETLADRLCFILCYPITSRESKRINRKVRNNPIKVDN